MRHNFQTGKTEAKLLDNDDVLEKSTENSDDQRTTSLTVHSDQPLKDIDGKSLENSIKSSPLEIPIEELKLKLKKIKSDETETLQNVRLLYYVKIVEFI